MSRQGARLAGKVQRARGAWDALLRSQVVTAEIGQVSRRRAGSACDSTPVELVLHDSLGWVSPRPQPRAGDPHL